MNRIKTTQIALQELQRIILYELKRVPGLRIDIYPDDIEPGPVVSH